MKTREIKGECPNCGSKHCTMIDNPNTGEDSRFCRDCGFSSKTTIENGRKSYESIDNPYGAYCIWSKSDTNNCEIGTLESEAAYDDFCGEIVSLVNQQNDIIYVAVNKYVDGVYKTEYLYGGVRVGDIVRLTVNALAIANYPDVEYKVVDMLEGHYDMPIVIGCEEMGEDWRQFVDRHEVIVLKK